MSTPVGTLLDGRYRLEARIGSGGMSTVYRAFDTVLERPVAIKLMHREIASDSDQLERFRREARAVAQLSHPHIVTVIDAGDDGDRDQTTPYIVFEHVDGETLKDRIRREGPLPVSDAVAYAIEIARALCAAHERRIVHRDVKPQNVLIDPEGRAKITDFGIARTLTEEGLTADGRVLGTTDYVSPEQALGQPVTGQSDVYSLGVVLYEMLTGDVPFHGDNPVAVAMRHVREEVPDVAAQRPGLSATLAAVVDHATAKNVNERYRDAAAMAADLEEVLAMEASRSGHAGPEATSVLRTLPSPARRRLPLTLRHSLGALIAIGLIAAAAVGVILYQAANHTHRGTGATPGLITPARLHTVPLAQGSAHDYDPFSSDGQEHPDTVGRAVDRDLGTAWMTEQYSSGVLGKPGVGLYLDAAPSVSARRLVIQTTTPGFQAQVWAADRIAHLANADPAPLGARGWHMLAAVPSVAAKQSVLISSPSPYRYYLLWITKLPPNAQAASISELSLFK